MARVLEPAGRPALRESHPRVRGCGKAERSGEQTQRTGLEVALAYLLLTILLLATAWGLADMFRKVVCSTIPGLP